jgi:polyphosphate:AMP phosphotransferase
MALPPRGQIGIFVGGWYADPIQDRVRGRSSDAELGSSLGRICAFEKLLVDGGTLIVKLWLHLGKKQQVKRFEKLEADPDTAWRVTKADWKQAQRYDALRQVSERALRVTSTGEAPWFVVEASDSRYRNVAVIEHVAEQIERRLELDQPRPAPQPLAPIDDPTTVLDTLDLTKQLELGDYQRELRRYQATFAQLSRKALKRDVGVILVFEGQDAAGKGGALRRITGALDARCYRVISIAAPTDEEKAHHYLWRFWRHLPRLGRFTIYDRSWYGRVLVERVEGFATKPEWMAAYKEINDFEEQLVEFGIVLVKFWLHISLDEQLRRFEEREKIPYKQYKITAEDYRNREKAHQYERAANDMVERTSTEYAPWTLVEAEDKRYARVKVLRTVCERLEQAVTAR